MMISLIFFYGCWFPSEERDCTLKETNSKLTEREIQTKEFFLIRQVCVVYTPSGNTFFFSCAWQRKVVLVARERPLVFFLSCVCIVVYYASLSVFSPRK